MLSWAGFQGAWDVRAAAALMKDMKWRAEPRVCELRSTSAAQVLGCDHNAPQTLAHYYQRRLLGVDAAGRVTLYQNYRTMLAKDLKRHIPLDTVLRFHVWEQERCASIADEIRRISRSRGDDGSLDFPAASTLAVLIDVGDMSITRHATRDFMAIIKEVRGWTRTILRADGRVFHPERSRRFGLVSHRAVARAETISDTCSARRLGKWCRRSAAEILEPRRGRGSRRCALDPALKLKKEKMPEASSMLWTIGID